MNIFKKPIKIQTRVITHPKREKHLNELLGLLENPEIFNDSSSRGAKYNHLQALTAPLKRNTTHLLIIEDDCIPVNNFYAKVEKVITENPNRMVSIYLGTGRPVNWQKEVDKLLQNTEGEYIKLPKLITGCAYIVPVNALPAFEPKNRNSTTQADFSIGEAYISYTKDHEIIYTKRSLVQHRDVPSLIETGRLYIPRVARELNND